MRKIILSVSVLLISLSSFAEVTSTSKLKYDCYGTAYNATLDIKMLGVDPYYGVDPIFNSSFKITFVNGQTVSQKREKGRTSPYRRLIPFGHGAYNNDESILIFGIGGANLGLDNIGSGLHLEVSKSSPDFAKLYLGHRDARQGGFDTPKYDATCRLRR